MNEKNRQRNYKIAITGAFGALTVVLGLTGFGFIPIGTLSVTIMHIPVILTTLIAGLVPGIGVGFIFGLFSLIQNAMGGGSPFFLNPMVSIVPRMLIAVVTWAVNKGFSNIPHMPKVVSACVASAFGTFANTLFVMTGIYVFFNELYMSLISGVLETLGFDVANLTYLQGWLLVIGRTMVTNSIWEIIAAVIITAAIISAIYVTKNKKSRLSKLDEES